MQDQFERSVVSDPLRRIGTQPLTIMGIFAVDLTFRAERLPIWGETVMGSDFRLGPGGKGSNQAIAAARLGGKVHFISKIGADTFGEWGRQVHGEAGVNLKFLLTSHDRSTGAAAILIDETTGENAIVVTPGAALALTTSEIDSAKDQIAASACFMTQLELSMDLVHHGLRLARGQGVLTILNPAPVRECTNELLELCDILTPNESEAAGLIGMPVQTMAQIESASRRLLDRGPKSVVITLGARGAFVMTDKLMQHVPAFDAGPVCETTGAGDAFNGGLALGLSEGMSILKATKFGCAAAAISVTRAGTAASMPTRVEVDELMAKGRRRNELGVI